MVCLTNQAALFSRLYVCESRFGGNEANKCPKVDAMLGMSVEFCTKHKLNRHSPFLMTIRRATRPARTVGWWPDNLQIKFTRLCLLHQAVKTCWPRFDWENVALIIRRT